VRFWKIWLGIGLLLLGFIIPVWLRPQLIGLDQALQTINALEYGNALMIDAFLIVSINTVISAPQFFSVVMIGEGMSEIFKRSGLKAIIPVFVMPAAYIIINLLTPLTYSFGATDIIIWVTVILMQKFSNQKLNMGMKLLVLSQFIFGITWLNQVPFLSPYGFGSGSLSSKIKEAALQIGFGNVLTLYAIVLFFIFVLSALVLWIYMALYVEKWAISQDLHRALLEAQESRSGHEVLHLVHDLKTPLASITGLVSLIELRWPEPKLQEYCQNIYSSADLMNKMISEMLYEDHFDCCEIKELMDYVRAGISEANLAVDFELDGDPHAMVYINKIRMTRAVINLIDNALNAIQGKENGKIILRAQVLTSDVKLEVEDNGSGISSDRLQKVWKAGYSTKNHPGLGLAFVRQIVKGHKGSINIKSMEGKGTKIWIVLPLKENH